MVAKLKREVAELKTQLVMGSEGGIDITEPLTSEELETWKSKCKVYLNERDPEASLDTGPDIRKINACFSFLKSFYLEVSRNIKESSVQPQQQNTLNQIAVVPQSAYDTKEVKDLKELLKQRDNEINILVGMLKKEKAKNMNNLMGKASTNNGANTSQMNPSNASSNKFDSSNSHIRLSTDSFVASSVASRQTSSVQDTTPVRHSESANHMSSGRSSPASMSSQSYNARRKETTHKSTVNTIVQRKIGRICIYNLQTFEVPHF